MNLLTKGLSKGALVDTGNANEIINALVCSPENIQCMYGVCKNCNKKQQQNKQTNKQSI